jgi:hypothetical protein
LISSGDVQLGNATRLDADQERLIADLTCIVSPALGTDEATSRALWLTAVHAWETGHSVPAEAISKMKPRDRARAALEIRDQFILQVRDRLSSAEQRVALSSAIEDAFALYMQRYNRRAR